MCVLGNKIVHGTFFSFKELLASVEDIISKHTKPDKIRDLGSGLQSFLDPEPMNESAWSGLDLVGGTMSMIIF